MLEYIEHESNCFGELKKEFNKMAEVISVLVNTRNSANPSKTQKHKSKDF